MKEQPKTASDITREDVVEAIARAGGPKAVKESFDRLRAARKQLETNYDTIQKEFPRHWLAIAAEGIIASVAVPAEASGKDHREALDRLLALMEESGANTRGCLVQYIDPEEGVMIL